MQTVGRFAPSPSGRIHLGNMFCSLLAWLSARSKGGRIVLRIEDLDRERSRASYADQVMRDFEMLGLTWDWQKFMLLWEIWIVLPRRYSRV